MSFVSMLRFGDAGTRMKVEVDLERSIVRITENYNTNYQASIVVTLEGLADITEAVEQYLEIESAAEYINNIMSLEE